MYLFSKENGNYNAIARVRDFFNISRIFLLIAFIFGTLYALIVPPFQVPDEFNHFFRTYHITEGYLVAERTLDGRVGGNLPQSLDIISKPFRHLPFHFEHKTSWIAIETLLNAPLNDKNRIFLDFPNTGLYAPTAYFPQALCVYMLKKINCPPLYMLYASRLVTLYFWIFMVFLALKITPISKGLLAFLALLPSSLFIAAGNNADVISNGLSFLIIAYILKGIFGEKGLTLRDIWMLGILISLLSWHKIVYFPFVFLLFLCKNNFDGQTTFNTHNTPPPQYFYKNWLKNKYFHYVFLIIIINIVIIAWWVSIIRPLQITYDEYHPFYRTILPQPLNENVNHAAQLTFILNNPIFYTKTLIYSVLKTSPHTLIHYIGKFGWEKNYFPHILNFTLFMLLILRGVSEKTLLADKKQNRLIKMSFIIVGLMMVATVATFLYLNSCVVGGDFIYNLSGKYFFPVFPLFFLSLSCPPNKFGGYILKFLQRETVSQWVLIFSLCYGIYAVLERYYVHY